MNIYQIMSVVCAILAVPLDLFFMYYLNRIAVCIPSPNQDKPTGKKSQLQYTNERCCDKYIRLSYPDYFFKPAETDNIDVSPIGTLQNNQYNISKSRCSILNCRAGTFLKIVNFWNVICGLLFMVLQIAFMINMVFQFLVACAGEPKVIIIIGIIVALFIGYIFWCVLRQSLNATLLLWHNVSNEFDTNIQYVWSFFHIIIWFIYLFVSLLVEKGNFDKGFWPTLLYWMILRGMIWILLFTFITFCVNICVVFYTAFQFHDQDDSYSAGSLLTIELVHDKHMQLAGNEETVNVEKDEDEEEQKHEFEDDQPKTLSLFDYKKKQLSYLNWRYFVFGITSLDDKNRRIIKYVLFVLFLILVLCLCVIPTKSYALKFAGIMLLFCYLTVFVLDKVDFDALYCLWSGKYHKKFWKNFRKFWDSKEFFSNTVTLTYFDFWCQLAKHKYQYWWGFRCKNDKSNSKKMQKCEWFRSICRNITILFLTITPFIFYITQVRTYSESNHLSDKVIDWKISNDSSPYPICESLDINNLNVLDLVFLTKAIYYPGTLQSGLNTWFYHDSPFNISYVDESNGTRYESTFAHLSKSDTDIILVRGTATKHDAIQDVSLWSEIGFIQIVSWIIPLTSITSTYFLRSYVYYASYPEGIIEPNLRNRYYNSVYDYIKTNLTASIYNEEKTIIILGHSLGGGIAQIVAAKLLYKDNANNVLSFGLASPGTLYTSKKFDFSVNSLHETSISVLPERDIVSQIDKHGGEIQNIKCQGNHPADCHFALTHFCELSENCGKLDTMKQTHKKKFAECVCGTNTENAKQWKDCYV